MPPPVPVAGLDLTLRRCSPATGSLSDPMMRFEICGDAIVRVHTRATDFAQDFPLNPLIALPLTSLNPNSERKFKTTERCCGRQAQDEDASRLEHR